MLWVGDAIPIPRITFAGGQCVLLMFPLYRPEDYPHTTGPATGEGGAVCTAESQTLGWRQIGSHKIKDI
jgi:hypothetical protein